MTIVTLQIVKGRRKKNQHIPLFIDDKDDILRYLDRIFRRCTTVDVSVLTTRTEDQVDALYQVNCLIDNLIIGKWNFCHILGKNLMSKLGVDAFFFLIIIFSFTWRTLISIKLDVLKWTL